MMFFKHTEKQLYGLLLTLFLLFSILSPANSAPLKVSVFALHPFGGLNEKGQIVGIIPEILNEIRNETGLVIDASVVPYKRMFKQLQSGSSDFAIFFRTHESEKIAIPKAKVYTLKNIVVGKKNHPLQHYEDLISGRIALPRGTFYEKTFDTDTRLNKRFVPGFINAVSLLLNDRTEFIAGPEISIAYHLRNLGSSPDILGQAYFLSHRSAWLQVSRLSQNLTPGVLLKLTNAIEKLRRNHTIENILKKYR